MSDERMIGWDETTGRTALSKSTISRMILTGEFPRPTKVNGRTLFFASEVAGWIEKQKAGRVGPAAGIRTAALR